ncbi:MAG: AsmA-like C-terminal region-containing protein, partial [Betaproteobacteria bacterium]
LKGMALTLPAPMNKPAAAIWPLRLETQLTKESLVPKSKVMQDQIKLSVARVLSLNYVRDVSATQTRVLRGAIALGLFTTEATPSRDVGVSLTLQQPNVDLDAWNEVMTQFTAAPVGKTKPRSTKTNVVGQEIETTGSQDYLPSLLTVRADQVKLADRVINRVVVGGVRMGELWRLNIAADELNGTAEVRPATATQAAQLYARLSFLNIPPSLVPDVERMLSDEPSSIPALDVVINDLTLRGKKLGRLEMDAVNRTSVNVGREWHLNKLNLTAPDGSLSATGSWAADGPKLRRTRLDFVMDIKDSGQLLTRLGTPNAVRNGHGKLQGKVSWQGSPITLDYPSMSGQLNLAIEKGQFLKTEPGAARLLGVLSLQALPRRLMLDFTDVFGEGFAFDFVRGDVRIEQGVATTNNLQMKGVSAGAIIEGSADIAKETQNLKVVVVPEINTSAATLYMAAINPLVGLTTYLSQLLLSKPLTKAGTSVFVIDGPWSNPRVTKSD